MMPDFVQETLETQEDFFSSCNNCEIKTCVLFDGNGGKICCGKIKYPARDVPFDIVRLCTISHIGISQQNLSPDEALETATLLTEIVNTWMYETKTYKKFRTLPNQKEA